MKPETKSLSRLVRRVDQRFDGVPREVVDKDHTREEFISSSTRHVLEHPQKKRNLMDDFLIEGDDK